MSALRKLSKLRALKRKLLGKARKIRSLYDFYKRKVRIAPHVEFDDAELADYVNLAHHAQVAHVRIGLRTSVGRYSKIQFADIGRYCSISWDVTIGALEHPLHSASSHAFPFRKQFGLCDEDRQIPHRKVTIGNDVWIGCGAIIMPGVQIGNGAVVGAGFVVTHSVEAYEIVAGCPAHRVGWRFPDEIRDALNAAAWWDWPDNQIKDAISLFDPALDLTRNNEILQRILRQSRTDNGKA